MLRPEQNLNEVDGGHPDLCIASVENPATENDRLTNNEASLVHPQLYLRKSLDAAEADTASGHRPLILNHYWHLIEGNSKGNNKPKGNPKDNNRESGKITIKMTATSK